MTPVTCSMSAPLTDRVSLRNSPRGCRRAPRLLAVLTLLLIAAGPAWTATITIDIAADNETANDVACTLREAINNANANGQTTGGDCTAGSGTDTIEFDIAGSSPIEIELTAALIVTDPVVIDGTTAATPASARLQSPTGQPMVSRCSATASPAAKLTPPFGSRPMDRPSGD